MRLSKTDWVLALDRYLGGMLVILCRMLLPLAARFRRVGGGPVKEIVVSKFVGLGSILLTQRLLLSLRESCPGSRIVFLTFDMNEPLLRRFGDLVQEVVLIDTRAVGSFILSSIRAIMRLARKEVDWYFDVEFFSRYSALMCFFSNPRASVGYESLTLSSRTSLYSHPAKFHAGISMSENFVNQVRTTGLAVNGNGSCPALTLPEDSIRRTRAQMEAEGLLPDRFIIFNANASDALGGFRRWPREKWVELVCLASRSFPFPIVFPGLSEDKKYVDGILQKIDSGGLSNGGVRNVAGLFDLEGYLALISMSRLVVTVDSGTSHFSVSLKKPTVILFGPETPLLYGYQLKFCRTVYEGLYCSPCYNIYNGKRAVCRNQNRCMTSIDAERVLDEMKGLLADA